jgi:hypothetical protein
MYTATMKVHEFWPASVANFVLLNLNCDQPKALIVGVGSARVAAELNPWCKSLEEYEQVSASTRSKGIFDVIVVLLSADFDLTGISQHMSTAAKVILIGAPQSVSTAQTNEFRRSDWNTNRYFVLPSQAKPLHFVPDNVNCISAFCDVEKRCNWIRKVQSIASWKFGLAAKRSEHAVATVLTRRNA